MLPEEIIKQARSHGMTDDVNYPGYLICEKDKLVNLVNDILEKAASNFEAQIGWCDASDERTELINHCLQVSANELRSL